MEVSEHMDSFIFDRRVVRRNIEKGFITQQEYLDHIKNLPDMAEQCEQVEESLYPDEKEEETPDISEADETAPSL